jgi:DNA-binding transcriptional ArsR family regulator
MFSKYPVADTASLLADPARVSMLTALLDGESRPAGELARIADLSPQAASAHLAKLTEGRLLQCVREGRHHYYKMARPEVGVALEALAVVSPLPKAPITKEGEEIVALRFARTCYDHLAGHLAVQLVDALVEKALLTRGAKEFRVTPEGSAFLASLRIEPAALQRQRRLFAKPCLDWTERKHHVSGSLGAALFSTFCRVGWLARRNGTRAVRLTDRGRAEFNKRFGLSLN